MTGKPIICTLCNGEMQQYTGPRYSRNLGWFLIISGILCTLFWVGAVLGIPFIIIGLYMIGARRQLWVCKECNTAIERIELKAKNSA